MVHALTGGGAERVAVSWANGLAAAGHDVEIYAHAENQTYTTSPEVRIINEKSLCDGSMSFPAKAIRILFGSCHSFYYLWRLIRREKPDVIINVLYIHSFPLLIARKLSGVKVPVIMTDHNSYERPEGIKMRRKQRRNKFFDNKFYDLVTVLTHRDKVILNSKGINNVAVLHNPLFLNPVKEIPPKEKIVLACGRIYEYRCKGFDILIRAWAKVAPKHHDWRLRIVGAGPKTTKEYLHSLAGDSAESVEFGEYTPNIVDEYRRAAIFTLSSRFEGWGLVMVEAMSQGCATIACDYLGRQAEAIEDGRNGVLCQPENIEELAEKIELLISDDELRYRLQQAAPPSTLKFSEANTAVKLIDLINSVKE